MFLKGGLSLSHHHYLNKGVMDGRVDIHLQPIMDKGLFATFSILFMYTQGKKWTSLSL